MIVLSAAVVVVVDAMPVVVLVKSRVEVAMKVVCVGAVKVAVIVVVVVVDAVSIAAVLVEVVVCVETDVTVWVVVRRVTGGTTDFVDVTSVICAKLEQKAEAFKMTSASKQARLSRSVGPDDGIASTEEKTRKVARSLVERCMLEDRQLEDRQLYEGPQS